MPASLASATASRCERIRLLCAGIRTELRGLRAEAPGALEELLDAQRYLLGVTASVNRHEKKETAPVMLHLAARPAVDGKTAAAGDRTLLED